MVKVFTAVGAAVGGTVVGGTAVGWVTGGRVAGAVVAVAGAPQADAEIIMAIASKVILKTFVRILLPPL
jgi:hypothetical protein